MSHKKLSEEELFRSVSVIEIFNLPVEQWQFEVMAWIPLINRYSVTQYTNKEFIKAYSYWLSTNQEINDREVNDIGVIDFPSPPSFETVNKDLLIWRTDLLERIAHARFEIKNELAMEQSKDGLTLCSLEGQLKESLAILKFIQHGKLKKNNN